MKRTLKTGLAVLAATTTLLGANALAFAEDLLPAPTVNVSTKGLMYTVSVGDCPTLIATSVRVTVTTYGTEDPGYTETVDGTSAVVSGKGPEGGAGMIAFATCMDGNREVTKTAEKRFEVKEGANHGLEPAPQLKVTTKGLTYTLAVMGCSAKADSIKVHVTTANSDDPGTDFLIKGPEGTVTDAPLTYDSTQIAKATCMKDGKPHSYTGELLFDVTKGSKPTTPEKPSLPTTGD